MPSCSREISPKGEAVNGPVGKLPEVTSSPLSSRNKKEGGRAFEPPYAAETKEFGWTKISCSVFGFGLI
jgi:hypothetical protein